MAICFHSLDVRDSKIVLNSEFHAVDSGFLDVGFRIPIVSEILDSLICIPDSKAQNSGFQE